ncbi:MAG: LpxL/LpxP family Kdo(2)-lipid IV(A) lauroyl/palmitoleoyl acyltransferase [Succinivibrionaceae bacterium]
MTDNNINKENLSTHKRVFTPRTQKYISKSQTNPHITLSMLKPKYWGIWLGVFILRFILLFPYSWFMNLGKLIGALGYKLAKKRVKITNKNLELAYPELSPNDHEKLAKEHFKNIGMAIFETGMAWFWSEKRLKKLVHINENELKNAKKLAETNKGIVVLTCHFVTLELMARIYGFSIKPGVGVYRPNNNIVMEYLQVKGRTRSNLYLVDRIDVRQIVKALIKGFPIWYAPDQDYGKHLPHVFAPFFAVKDACTVIGTAGFAKIKNTVVQPSYTIRLPNNKGYKLVIKPILQNFPNGDDLIDATTCNKVIEEMISEAPEQYMWLHRRFKTTPDGVTNRYQ